MATEETSNNTSLDVVSKKIDALIIRDIHQLSVNDLSAALLQTLKEVLPDMAVQKNRSFVSQLYLVHRWHKEIKREWGLIQTSREFRKELKGRVAKLKSEWVNPEVQSEFAKDPSMMHFVLEQFKRDVYDIWQRRQNNRHRINQE